MKTEWALSRAITPFILEWKKRSFIHVDNYSVIYLAIENKSLKFLSQAMIILKLSNEYKFPL